MVDDLNSHVPLYLYTETLWCSRYSLWHLSVAWVLLPCNGRIIQHKIPCIKFSIHIVSCSMWDDRILAWRQPMQFVKSASMYVMMIRFVCLVASPLDMRKALSRDVEKKSVVPLAHPVRPEELEWPWVRWASGSCGDIVTGARVWRWCASLYWSSCWLHVCNG